MSIRTQLIIVALLSIFVVTPILAMLMGLYGLIINAICTYIIFDKYWKYV
jgi:hypothetical protein